MPGSFGALEVAVVGRSGTVSWAVVVVVVGATGVAILGAPGRQALDGNVVFFVCYVELYPSAVATGFAVVSRNGFVQKYFRKQTALYTEPTTATIRRPVGHGWIITHDTSEHVDL